MNFSYARRRSQTRRLGQYEEDQHLTRKPAVDEGERLLSRRYRAASDKSESMRRYTVLQTVTILTTFLTFLTT